jgi:hypothetical protein
VRCRLIRDRSETPPRRRQNARRGPWSRSYRIAGQFGVRMCAGRAGQQLAGEQIQDGGQIQLPSSVEISVISPHHLVFGAAAVKSRRTKSGNFGAVLSCFLSPRRCLGFRPSKPWRRIESATVFTLTDQPSSIKSAWMRGEPYVPPEVANAALIVASSSSRRSCWSVGLRSSHL